LDHFPKLKHPVVTLGTFDGVHIGHKSLITRLGAIARAKNGETVLLTFEPHPRIVLHGDDNLKLLQTEEEKISSLLKAGIDHLIIYPFTKEFAALSSEEFVEQILVKAIGTKTLVIGFNHQFGKNREGSFENLKRMAPLNGFELVEIEEKSLDQKSVSSTKIRNALMAGDVELAAAGLGYLYCMKGKVTEGNHLGQSIGFPTANIILADKHKLVPADGVYAVHVKSGWRIYKGMMNIGFRPTIDGKTRTIEAHIIDFDKQIYGEDICIFFKARIREEKKFENLEELKHQLEKDRITTINILG
jgi:riboflavin kinase/FMN adenylyltransferase